MSSTPVAMLCTSTRSPPTWRATSARSGIEATTRSTPSACARAASRTAAARTAETMWRCMAISSAIPKSVHVASDDGRPLQEELALVVLRRVQILVLEADTLELRGPNRQVGRVGERGWGLAVQRLHPLEEEPGIEPAPNARLDVAVEADRILWPENRHVRGAGVPRLVIEEYLGTPHQAAITGLAQRDVAVGQFE